MKIYKLYYVIAALFLLASCDSREDAIEAQGGIMLQLKQQADTRHTPGELVDIMGIKPVAENFDVEIVNNKTGALLYSGKFPDGVIPASVGNYSVTAAFGENLPVALNSPYYRGEATVAVELGQTASVEIPCRVANALLSVKYIDEGIESTARFEKFLSTYGVRVAVGSYSVNIEEGSKASAYFPAGSQPRLQFYGTLKNTDGKEVTYDIVLPDGIRFDEATHVTVSLSYAAMTSGAILTVEKVETEVVTIENTIPLEWLPKPQVQGFGGAYSLEHIETAAPRDAIITCSGVMPLQDVEFTFSFAGDSREKYAAVNGKTFSLAQMSDEDRALFAAAGISLPAIDGVSKVAHFDLTNLTASLQTLKGNAAVNSIKLRVKANNRWSSEVTYTIKVVSPRFQISVDACNVWTKQFTTNPLTEQQVVSGSFDAICSDLKYQYSRDGQNWSNMAAGLISKNLQPGTTYYVRALYRNAVPSEVSSVKTYPETPLPNGNMEQWNMTNTREGVWPTYQQVPRYYPSLSGDADAWWATNMERAVIWSAYPYAVTTTPNVSYVYDAHSGSKAAELRNSGHGGGYATTNTPLTPNLSVTYDEAAFAGRLFIGTYSWSNKQEHITTGHSYSSRPTAMEFWYKYTPYNSDAFLAEVYLMSGDKVIASGSFVPAAYSTADAGYVRKQVELQYSTDASLCNLAPTSIYINFASTAATTLKRNEQFGLCRDCELADFGKKNCHYGSALKIDDISLIYGK